MSIKHILKDISPSTISAGLVAVLVGFASSVAIVFQAAQAAGADNHMMVSWILALGIGMGITCFGFSIWYRIPIITAWSTPGAALLAVSLTDVPIAQAIGAFVFCGLLIFLLGISGLFNRIMKYLPLPIAAAMLAGILFKFGLNVFISSEQHLGLIASMLVAYILGKRVLPRYAVLLVLAVGLVFCLLFYAPDTTQLVWHWPTPVWVTPAFDLNILLGTGLPLFIVTMASQNVPGVATLKASGYQDLPLSPIMTGTGLTTMLLAPLGGFTFNLAAITAAICTNEESHTDPAKRYIAGLAAGVFYFTVGIAGAWLIALFTALPASFIAALAGIALFSTIANSLYAATSDAQYREAAIVTLLITASGMQLAGIASPFWGLIGGMMTHLLLSRN
ncbi:benzoate/H(+) symporter BenE family transporter [Neptunicella marina]|uniref:Benzoate/H(+) symporter BenE family transporter n=1 Tax=Neptunicella marina TaxID=2125989 RepID=A0A8J6IWK5_9ALTE|nr:benzoate/H(+) symporter BenE family transporter [Neptunicella marina]MBC3766917.1 benzoate/H(+) symporter BenE family transporter [Neptunicella marina]